MIFGDHAWFEKSHFEKHKGYAPAYLCELVVYCLELLNHLSRCDLPFRFKGGTSLLLLLDIPYRFSLDIDIDTPAKKDDLSAVMTKIVDQCELFRKIEIRPHKTKPWLPMISYNVYFDSCYQAAPDSFLMLDAVIKSSPTDGFRRPIRVGRLYESEQTVEVTQPAGLLGDKLLTLCPATVGIPLGKGKAAQRLKHVFDCARLLETGARPEQIRPNLHLCLEQENQIQQAAHDVRSVLADIRLFAGAAEGRKTRPDPGDVNQETTAGAYLYEIVTGFDEFRSYVFNRSYDWADLGQDLAAVKNLVDCLD